VADQISLRRGEFLRVDYVGTVPAGMRGRVRVDALDLDAPTMIVRLSSPRGTAEPAAVVADIDDSAGQAGAAVAAVEPAPVNVLAGRSDADPNLQLDTRISALEPMFFAAGYGSDANAQVQLSFKLRLHEPVDKTSREFWDNFYFGYTQPAYWDLTSDSKPFIDTNYMPSFFYYVPGTDWLVDGNPVGIAAGYEHESNGRDGEDSRSLDILFARPYFDFGDTSDFHWSFSPKMYAYIEKDENSDIADYRGYGDFHVSYGKPNDWQLASILRKGTSGDQGSVELQGTYPLHRWFPGVTGYFMVQAFSGYGEYLLNYNKREDLAVRVGYAITR
jgi:outer membrane phospholipase A